ncbi:MAG: alpha/beta fold hydrolase, partial [Planctomycetota bacterium]
MKRRLLLLYLLLLVASNLTRFLAPPSADLAYGDQTVSLQHFADGERRREQVKVVFRQRTPYGSPTVEDLLHHEVPPDVVLLHGSPGNLQDFDAFAERLPSRFKILIPDLPGFGKSWAPLPEYSAAAHADYLVQLLDKRSLQKVHLVGFSMGSAVALEFAHRFPHRVASITFIGGIGVQELELFGTFPLNHTVHAVQLGAISIAEWLLPHFGVLDRWPLNRAYARNFFDTDQRPYRAWLKEVQAPMRILHGAEDFLVPVEAAREHHRLVAHSSLVEFPGNHFLLWTQPGVIAEQVASFVDAAHFGEAPTAADATPSRLAAAGEPFDPAVVPPFTGPSLWFAMLLLALATLVSEDLTCIATGLLVAQGRIGLVAGSSACFFGILLGDVLLFLAGRALGRRAVSRIPLRWILTPGAVARASAWFRRSGAWVIFASRFMPGLRLPTYFAAGVLKTRFLWFLFYFSLAGILWTPTLVWLSSRLGIGAEVLLARFQEHALWVLLGLSLLAFLLVKLVVPSFSFRGRSSIVGAARRRRHWEYWSRWRLYLPVVPAILGAAWKHRSLRIVTAVNPALAGGGLVGESKSTTFEILRGEGVPPFLALNEEGKSVEASPTEPAPSPSEGRIQAIRQWMESEGLGFPIILKPDAGERGNGVRRIHDFEQAKSWCEEFPRAGIAQAYVGGLEFGISYRRGPGEERGKITSLGAKIPPTVTGDGHSDIEHLILTHERHVAMADVLLGGNAERLFEIPAQGEVVALGDMGTHSRGALCL